MDMSSAMNMIKKIDGWLTDKEMQFLYNTARGAGLKGAIVEIGSWKGKSTVCLALGLKNSKSGKKVYAVDWHKGSNEHGHVNTFREFKKNIKKSGVSHHVVPVVMKSENAAKVWSKKKAPISFLWIDGSHEYEDVKKDFVLWNPYLIEGGIIAFHDTLFWSGPKRIVNEFVFKGNFRNIGIVDDITYGIKANMLTPKDKFHSSYVRCIRDLTFIRRFYSPQRIREFLLNKLR